MKILASTCSKYESHYRLTADYDVYGICFDCPKDKPEKELYALFKREKYLAKKYPNIKVITGLSRHANGSYRTKERTGKKGKPKTIIRGRKTKPHIHSYLAVPKGTSGFYTDVCRLITTQNRRQDKNNLPKAKMWKSTNADNKSLCCMPVKYVEKQSDIVRRYGDLSVFE